MKKLTTKVSTASMKKITTNVSTELCYMEYGEKMAFMASHEAMNGTMHDSQFKK